MEPNFSEVCEHIKERLLRHRRQRNKKKKRRKRQRENQIRAQHKREVEEWESKSIIARAISKPPKEIRLEDLN